MNTLNSPESELTLRVPKPGIHVDSQRQPTRRIAREITLRAVYVLEMRGCTTEQALLDTLVSDNGQPPAYTVRLLTHIEQYLEQLDDFIRAKVEKWEFHRIALIDRLILRIAIAELLYFPDVPPKVTINEAIEIAKNYSTMKSGRFVNGILDAVYGDINRGIIKLNGNGSGS